MEFKPLFLLIEDNLIDQIVTQQLLKKVFHVEEIIIANNGKEGIEWLQDNKTGFLVPCKDVHALSEKIQFLLSNPSKALAMGREGRIVVEQRFNADRHVSRLIELFEGAR